MVRTANDDIKSYSAVMLLPTLEERFEYLKLKGKVGAETFGYDRYLNQVLYHDPEWRHIRNDVIIRDNGCDLGVDGHEIHGRILIHHINPITIDDVKFRRYCVFDLDNLICTSHNTHNAIHYGDANLLPKNPIERKPNDTCPWRR